ncbi:MAG: DNA-protecting protein DprA, partial [candidate division NC10 bacterium]|nr:DNA-protecting protein DprA [candidate division NC10 bacterium]
MGDGGMMEEREAWLSLNLIPQVGPVTFEGLLERFGSASKALQASYEELCKVPGIGPAMAQSIASFPWREALAEELGKLQKWGLNYLTLKDEGYPAYLREIPQPPPVLYLRGGLASSDRLAVAIVGARRATPYGMTVAENLAGELAARGITIVSGMARGIDAAAHQGALSAGGRTLAVWGSGLDIVYPTEHKRLAAAIAE